MKSPCKSAAALSLLWTVLAMCSGCQATMALGAFESIGSASPTALHHLGRGKIESYWAARFEDVVQGTEAGGEALSLTLIEKQIGKDQALFRYKDDRGDPITLAIERRTATMSSILIDVGFAGSPAFAKLFARQVLSELIDAGVFSDDAEEEIDEGNGYKNL